MGKLTGTTRFGLMFMVVMAAIIAGTNAEREGKIENGVSASRGDGSFVVRLELTGPKGGGKCTGAIVGHHYVLTAAHCLEGMTGGSVIGGTSRRSDPNAIVSDIVRLWMHPQFDSVNGGYDVGVIQVDRDLVVRDRTVAIPITSNDIDPGVHGHLFGWSSCGSANLHSLQIAIVRFLSKEDCAKQSVYDYPGMICAVSDTSASCPGDSGGPVVTRARIVGIHTNPGGGLGKPYGGQSVYYHRTWINSIVRD